MNDLEISDRVFRTTKRECFITLKEQRTKLKQWKNVYSCIEWFKALKNKKQMAFIIFDIETFYPTITLELLENALSWAKEYVDISDEAHKVILSSRKSFLVNEDEFWSKKQSPDFDVPMGDMTLQRCVIL